jgi:subtilisin family serine protease
MKQKLFNNLFLLLISHAANAASVVAVIDTGIDPNIKNLCKSNHKDFSGSGLNDDFGHGTHIAGLINKYSGKVKFCLVNIKYYYKLNSNEENTNAMKSSIRYAIDIKADIINISGGGLNYDAEEHKLIKEALDKNIKVIVAAGNESMNLNENCNYYPACYDKRLTVVGNLNKYGHKSSFSNYGKAVNAWENGTDAMSNLPNGEMGTMSGTSQATAIFTGKYLSSKLK